MTRYEVAVLTLAELDEGARNPDSPLGAIVHCRCGWTSSGPEYDSSGMRVSVVFKRPAPATK